MVDLSNAGYSHLKTRRLNQVRIIVLQDFDTELRGN
jgi:hypothetical protein